MKAYMYAIELLKVWSDARRARDGWSNIRRSIEVV